MVNLNTAITTYEVDVDLDYVIDSSLQEIIAWFSSKAHVKSKPEDRQRFVFSDRDLDYIMSKLSHPEYIVAHKELDDCGNLFCYTLDYTKDIIIQGRQELVRKINKTY